MKRYLLFLAEQYEESMGTGSLSATSDSLDTLIQSAKDERRLTHIPGNHLWWDDGEIIDTTENKRCRFDLSEILAEGFSVESLEFEDIKIKIV